MPKEITRTSSELVAIAKGLRVFPNPVGRGGISGEQLVPPPPFPCHHPAALPALAGWPALPWMLPQMRKQGLSLPREHPRQIS